jgi:hypothetical protein
MCAIVLEKFGGLDSLVYKDLPEPEPKAGHGRPLDDRLDAADGRWRGQVDLRPKTAVCWTAHLPRL